jgi:hypothetical protein
MKICTVAPYGQTERQRDVMKLITAFRNFANDPKKEFYILLTVHLDVILVNDQLDALFLHVFISCLYMFRATSAHHQEGQIVLIHHLV